MLGREKIANVYYWVVLDLFLCGYISVPMCVCSGEEAQDLWKFLE